MTMEKIPGPGEPADHQGLGVGLRQTGRLLSFHGFFHGPPADPGAGHDFVLFAAVLFPLPVYSQALSFGGGPALLAEVLIDRLIEQIAAVAVQGSGDQVQFGDFLRGDAEADDARDVHGCNLWELQRVKSTQWKSSAIIIVKEFGEDHSLSFSGNV